MRPNVKKALFAFALCALAMPSFAGSPAIRMTVEPGSVLIESSRKGQYVSFGLRVENPRTDAVTVDRLEVAVFDRKGAFLLRRYLESANLRHDDRTVLTLEPGASVFLYNPFDTFDAELEIGSLRYTLTLESAGR